MVMSQIRYSIRREFDVLVSIVGLGNNIAEIMSIKRISTEDLAVVSGVSVDTIGKLGMWNPNDLTLEVILKLAHGLEVSVDTLLSFSDKYTAATYETGFDTCETKSYKCLKYTDNRYLSWDIHQFPLTPRLSQARRFQSTEAISIFLTTSYYRPQVYNLSPGDFEIVDIEVLYKEKSETLEGDV